MRSTKPTAKTSHLLHTLALALVAGLGVACGQLEVPLNLAVQPGSTVTLFQPFEPPYDVVQAGLVGGVEGRAIVSLGLWSLINPNGIPAVIEIDDVLIAADSLLVAGFIPTGTVCIEPAQDPPGSGMAYFQTLRNKALFMMDLFTQIRVTDPVTAGLFGEPLAFDASVDAEVDVTLTDLLGLLGGGGSLTIDQQISTTIPDDVPLLGGSPFVADITLVTVDEIPADLLLLDCLPPAP